MDKEWEKLEKIPAWDLTKVGSKKEVIDEARTKGAKVHFASLMDVCHLKNVELEPQFQKYKGRVVLRGETVKDDSGSFAVFSERGSSASQMTAAKVLDVIARQPGCSAQAADVISAYTQVKMEDVPSLMKIPKSECPDIRIHPRYLKGTQHTCLRLEPRQMVQKGLLEVVGHGDSDWAGDSATRQSVTGYHCDVQNVTLCNRSLKQTAISLSSCEAEFYAASACAGELLGLAELFKELHYNVSVRLEMDSDSARHSTAQDTRRTQTH